MRRQVLPNPRFQITFILSILKGFLLTALIPGLSLFLVIGLIREHAQVLPEQKAVLNKGLNQLFSLYLWLVGSGSVVSTILGGALSHKFAGPMARIEGWASKQLSEGQAGQLKLRGADEWGPVAHVLNRVIGKYF